MLCPHLCRPESKGDGLFDLVEPERPVITVRIRQAPRGARGIAAHHQDRDRSIGRYDPRRAHRAAHFDIVADHDDVGPLPPRRSKGNCLMPGR